MSRPVVIRIGTIGARSAIPRPPRGKPSQSQPPRHSVRRDRRRRRLETVE